MKPAPGVEFAFDPFFKIKRGHHTKRPHISLIIGARALECKNSPWEVLVCKCFACEQVWPILKTKWPQ